MQPLEPRDHRIAIAEAAKHTSRHRASLKDPAEGDHGASFHADQVLTILAQQGCTALRIYYGRNEKGSRSLILIGVDARGMDMESGPICELGMPCPPYCPDGTLAKD